MRGPLKNYISWFVKEVQCGEAGDNVSGPEIAWNKKRSVVGKENTEGKVKLSFTPETY